MNYTYSKFDNGNTQLQWTNPFFGGVDTTYLASDNTYQRIAANGVLRGLPGSSTFAARYTWAKTHGRHQRGRHRAQLPVAPTCPRCRT